MSDSKNAEVPTADESEMEAPDSQQNDKPGDPRPGREDRRETRRWWIKLFIQPVLLLACGAVLFAGLGVAQRFGFISGGGGERHELGGGQAMRYICPMMCTPPQSEPGRCPVCAMELVAAASGAEETDSRSIKIDPATRRVANIRTVAVRLKPMTRTIRAIGELHYDEGTLKTISAYVDGRLDRLYADYTGVVVETGDHLALLYSPQLYSAQVELLLARKAQTRQSSTLARVVDSNRSLYESARQRLIELGMTPLQIEQLEAAEKANSRMHLCAPSSGTVIEKFVVEGQYVKEGQAIYKLADLSTVWLMLELFPEDAATIRYGQKVDATVQSLQGRNFSGRVAFIDPNVDPKTRTVGVRVVIRNQKGVLRVGDYAKATIEVPLGGSIDRQADIYDPELANKWISPRHPHVIESAAGKCRICGIDLVPAARFGFTAESVASKALVVPRDAVLMAGSNSVLYVETEPGRFEIRSVVLGPSGGEEIVIVDGVEQGEQVATQGNFLIDSQMQLVGNPSLIDPTKAESSSGTGVPAEMIATLSKLSPEDRSLAETQRICPVTTMPLGSMGAPPRVDVNGKTVLICCEGCRERLLDEPEKYLANLSAAGTAADGSESAPADLPPIGAPEIVEPGGGLPPIEAPQAILNGTPTSQPARHSPKRVAERLPEVVR